MTICSCQGLAYDPGSPLEWALPLMQHGHLKLPILTMCSLILISAMLQLLVFQLRAQRVLGMPRARRCAQLLLCTVDPVMSLRSTHTSIVMPAPRSNP